jgi:A1 cistron-splicing factor AAR2
MDPRQRFLFGAFFIVDQLPPDRVREFEFGIDLHQWTLDTRFRGFKMIPPGFHVIHYSSRSRLQRHTFLRHFQAQELLVVRYNTATESFDICLDGDTVAERRQQLMEMDASLAAYPLDAQSEAWPVLTSRITPPLLIQVVPHLEMTSMTASNIPDETGMQVDDKLALQFTPLDLKRSFHNLDVGMDRTRWAQDKSWLLQDIIQRSVDILGELQLGFVALLVGQNYEGFEQWKRLIICCCFSQHAQQSPDYQPFFCQLVDVLIAQCEAMPKDFFLDMFLGDNFLKKSMKQMYATAFWDVTLEDIKRMHELRTKLQTLDTLMSTQFAWPMGAEALEDEKRKDAEEDEDGPVIVEL